MTDSDSRMIERIFIATGLVAGPLTLGFAYFDWLLFRTDLKEVSSILLIVALVVDLNLVSLYMSYKACSSGYCAKFENRFRSYKRAVLLLTLILKLLILIIMPIVWYIDRKVLLINKDAPGVSDVQILTLVQVACLICLAPMVIPNIYLLVKPHSKKEEGEESTPALILEDGANREEFRSTSELSGHGNESTA